jgi:hypothetical protein
MGKHALARNKLAVILRASATKSRERLEGWKQARCLWPSFETPAFGRLLRMTGEFVAPYELTPTND